MSPDSAQSGPGPVTSTYRLQIHPGFTLDDAVAVVPRLVDLGVSHVYLSPVLSSQPGSTHGYDVVDHTAIDPEIGGREALERLADAAHGQGLGVVVDVVPNHMALTEQAWRNPRLWEYLREGPEGPAGAWFDVDLEHLDGRIGLPVLGGPLEEVASAGDLVLATGRDDEGPAAGRPVLRYYDRVLPLRPDAPTEGDVLEVLAAQHYRLANWRDNASVLNYRRFFEVDELIAIRVEDEQVFEDSHRLLLDLHHAGIIDGFRIDHPDGLADPGGYLARLAAACRPDTPIWVEKILIGDERLPQDWPVAGTTGYDGLLAISTALTPTSAESVEVLDETWREADGVPEVEEVVAASQELAVDALLRPEVSRLERLVVRDTGATPEAAHGAVRERLLATTVYREYGSDADLGAIQAVAGDQPLSAEVATRLQQTTGPVMAKGVEDTAFYRWHRLTALNEVGGEPGEGRHPSAERLHAWAAYQQGHWPFGMVAQTTHDTKRSADVRSRLLALAAHPERWAESAERARDLAREKGVDQPTGHLIWQSIVGLGTETLDVEPDRLDAFVLKAVREAKEHTAWVDGDEAYEERVIALGRALLADAEFRRELSDAVSLCGASLHRQVLGATALHLTLPGIPDVYQGTEGIRLSLVDPDNRRPVDHDAIDQRLRDAREFADDPSAGFPRALDARKLLVTSRLLRLRRDHPDLVGADADYTPLDLGAGALGFLRGSDLAIVITLSGLDAAVAASAGSAVVPLPQGRWVDVVTGAEVSADGPTSRGPTVADLTSDLPIAVLRRLTDRSETTETAGTTEKTETTRTGTA